MPTPSSMSVHTTSVPHAIPAARLTIHNVGITHLDLSRCSGLRTLECMRALNSLPNVTDLRLNDNPDWHADSLRWLFHVADPCTTDPVPQPARLTTLTNLDLTGCPQFATVESLALLRRQPALTQLTFKRAKLNPEIVSVLVRVPSHAASL